MKSYTPVNIKRIELSSLKEKNHILQTGFWGDFKSNLGWTPCAFSYEWKGREREILVLVRKIAKIFPIAYVPGAPQIEDENPDDLLPALSWQLVSELPIGTLFIRYDLKNGITEDALEARKGGESDDKSIDSRTLNYPMRKSPVDIQPPDSVVLDISRSEDEILAGMHKKWRYNIRLAGKKGVTVKIDSGDRLSEWYDLYRITSERDRIAIHPESYYRRLFELSSASGIEDGYTPKIYLLTAEHEDDLLAGIIVSVCGDTATYLYGASSNVKRNYMPAYLLQWEALRLAKEQGAQNYDFYGIPPSADKNHPMHGLFLFKTGFGGEIQHYTGSWDFPYSRLFYTLYSTAERVRQWYYKKFRKR